MSINNRKNYDELGEVLNKEFEKIEGILNKINCETDFWLLRGLTCENEWGNLDEIRKTIDFHAMIIDSRKLINDSLDALNTLNISQELIGEIFTPVRIQYIIRLNIYTLRMELLLKWYEFYLSETKYLSKKDSGKFRSIFGEIFHYLKYLQIINERYEAYSQDYKNNWKAFQDSILIDNLPKGVTQKLNSEQRDLQNRNRIIETNLHLEIESFYQFAKILLDKISISVKFYFGDARSLPLSSHDKFTTNIEMYAQKKKLSSYENVSNQAKKLKKEISDFRDKRIDHLFGDVKDPDKDKMIESLARGTSCVFGNGGNSDPYRELPTIIIASLHSGKEYKSKSLVILLVAIEEYIGQMLVFIKANKEKTVFEKFSLGKEEDQSENCVKKD